MKYLNKYKNIIFMLLIAVLLLSADIVPVTALARNSDSSLCSHHPKHTEECGYEAGNVCTHRHTSDCYEKIEECIHICDEKCFQSESKGSATSSDAASGSGLSDYETSECNHVCTVRNGCIKKELVCPHLEGDHDESCGYTATSSNAEGSPCEFVCPVCTIQNRVDDLPGISELEDMDEKELEEVLAELDDIYEEIERLRTVVLQLQENRLETMEEMPDATENNARTIKADSTNLVHPNANIEKVDDKTFNIIIPDVTEDSELSLESIQKDLSEYRFTAEVTDPIETEASDIEIPLNSNAKLKYGMDKDAGDNILPGTYTITLNFSEINDMEDVVFSDGSQAVMINLIVGRELADESEFEPYRIQTVSPENVTINLFDYWIMGQYEHDHPGAGNGVTGCGDSNCKGDSQLGREGTLYKNGVNDKHAFVFGSNPQTIGKWNMWTGESGGTNGVYPDIVKNMLEDGYPVLNLTQDEVNSAYIGQKEYIFKDYNPNESLKYLFSPENDKENGKAAYEDVKGLLTLDPETGNYKYNSLKNFASFSEIDMAFNVYKEQGVKFQGINGQFFPFNKASQVFKIDGSEIKDNGVDAKTNALINHYFGLTMETEFQQPPNGKISNGANKKDMIFEFSGDDDVWIFIDDVLVADLGGIHDAVSVAINFSTGNIKIDREDKFTAGTSSTRKETTIKQQFMDAGQEIAFSFKGNTFADNTVHKLKMFYLERGNSASNLELSFNLMEPDFSNIVKVDQDGQGLDGVSFELYEANDSWATEGNAIAKLTTDDGGFVDFVVENANGRKSPIEFKANQKYVLKEVETLPGYVTTGDIRLTYDETNHVMKVENQWETGAVAGFEAQVYQTVGLSYSNEDKGSANEAGKKGLILAVPLYNPVKKGATVTEGWRPLYGSATEGFHMIKVEDGSDEAYRKAVLEAALRQIINPENEHWHLDYDQDMMRYEGRLVDLPGSVDRYIFVNQKDGDMLTAYYLLNPDSDIFENCETAEDKHKALAAAVSSEEEIQAFVKDQQKNMRLLNIDDFNRLFYARLYIPNQVRELRIHKQDEAGNALAGAEFTLYSDINCTKAEAKGITDENGNLTFSGQNTGNNGVNGGELTSDVYFALAREDANDGGRKDRSYWLKETKAPKGYDSNEAVTEVRITKDSIYVNAGSADNGVTVRKGVGKLLQTMVRYAADDELNVTLRDITATKYIADEEIPGAELPVFGSGKWAEAKDEQPLSLHYGLDNAKLDYGLHDTDRNPYFETDTGWIGFGVEQNYKAHTGGTDEWSQAGGIKEDLTNGNVPVDISALLTGTTTIIVTDEKTPPGNLTVSKVVAGDDGDKEKEWNFTVTLSDSSVNGDYGDISFTDGTANFTLKHGESRTASGLLTGITYEVEEKEANQDGYTTVSVGAAGAITETGALAAFTNTKNKPPVTPDQEEKTGNLTVTKTVAGNAGNKSKDFNFTVTLSDASIKGKYGDMEFADGAAVFTLKHGESQTAIGLPAGITYKVVEKEAGQDGYTTTSSGEYGTITEGDLTAAFLNVRDRSGGGSGSSSSLGPGPGSGAVIIAKNDPGDGGREMISSIPLAEEPEDIEHEEETFFGLPQTGDDRNPALWLTLLAISGIGIIILAVCRRSASKEEERRK